MARAIRFVLLIAMMAAVSAASFGAVLVSVTIAPPLLPVYLQPVCPGEGYIWVPGYWAYGDYGYYWVPGTWVPAPFIGALWTPGYWGWDGGVYVWNEGYWGPHIGFYGGIDYGFGYLGVGYAGGYWNNGSFYYNTTVNNVNTAIVHNVYRKTVFNNATISRVSHNGGNGGTMARPTAVELAATRDRHTAPTSAQTQLRRSASINRAQLASVNHGRPAVLATPSPAAYSAHANRQPSNRPASRSTPTGKAVASHKAPPPHYSARNNAVPRPAVPPNQTLARHTTTPSHYSARNNAPPRPAAHPNHALAQRPAPPPSHYSARNNPVPRPATPPSHAMAQRPAPHINPEPRHAVPPPSHYSARANPLPRPGAQPQHSAPQQHSAPAHEGAGNPRSRESGHS